MHVLSLANLLSPNDIISVIITSEDRMKKVPISFLFNKVDR